MISTHPRKGSPLRGLASLAPFLLLGCRASEPKPAPTPAAPAPSAPSTELLRAQVQSIARDFETWGALDTTLRVAPTDCRMPRIQSSGPLTISLADTGAHATKLYLLYARDPAAYRGVESGAPQAHQVLVKESFAAEPFEMPGPGKVPDSVVRTPQGMFQAGAPTGLFVMLRDASPEASESAWTYATVDPSGAISALGRLESCIRCHRDAPHGGLFGLER